MQSGSGVARSCGYASRKRLRSHRQLPDADAVSCRRTGGYSFV
jgi:hypothetical protein